MGMYVDIIQYGLVTLPSCNPGPLDPPRFNIDFPRERPCNHVHDYGRPDKPHRYTEGCCISRRIPRVEKLRSGATTDLAVTIGESDSEGRASRSLWSEPAHN